MLSLHLESTETARLHNNYKELDRLFQAALGKTKTILDQTDFYQSKILAAVARNQTIDALETADEFLLKMGFKILSQPDQLDLQVEVDKILERLANADIEELITNPQQSDPLRQAATKILQSAAGAAYLDHQDMFPIYAIRFLDLAFGFSNISDTAVACVVLGTILCGSVGDIEAGFRFGRLALDLLKRSDATELEAKIYFGFEFMIHHWKDHLRNSFDLLEKGYHSGVENGDFEFAGYNAFWHGFHLFLAGLPLEEVKNKLQLQADKIRQIKQVAPFGYNSIFQQTVLNLQAEKRTSQQLTGSIYDERAMLPIHQQYGDRLAIFFLNFCKMILSYLFEDYHEALKCADNAMENKDKAMGQAAIPVLIFFSSLNRLALFGKAVPRQQRGALAKIKESQLTMKKWADQAPMNNLHRYHLVEAELSRVLGQDEKALEHYNKSCELARENGYCHEEALANELTGKFWLKKEKLEFAGLFMQRALHCYALWGATSKINHLVERYSKLLVRMGIDTGSRMSSALNAPHGVRSFTNMDLQTMIKASQAISGEIILEKLLTTLMRIVIENAGAESGFFLLNSGDKLLIAAQGAAEDGVVKIRSLDPLEEGEQQMSTAIIQYVARTRKYVILNNAAEEGEFKTTPYIQAHLPKSILCIPIVYKSELTGLLYLENRLVPGIFSSSRLEMLELLVSQVAISIENARLFEEQKRAEEKYRGIFENAIEGIFQATPNGCFLSANSATALLFGFESPEELCRDITDIPTQLFTLKDTWDKFLVLITENNTVNEYEIQCFRKDGAKIWISLNAKSILADHKEIELIEGFIIDISERKYATEALLQREESLRKENLRLRSNIKDRYRFGQIIGKSQVMQDVYDLILKAAAADANVIVYGESGTGKELVAHAIHEMSDRKKGSFVPVNCGAIPQNLLESEFFGYKKGAFTGATTDKKGCLDLAHGGTLFLDELGEIDLNFQVKLLRALEDGGYTPLGGQSVQRSNARIVAATNRDLAEAIRQGVMREDFFYRIHIIPIHLPPLRERKEDIPLLIEHFMAKNNPKNPALPLPGDAIETILNHDWPGNVRELQNVLHRYNTLGRLDIGDGIRAEDPMKRAKTKEIEIEGEDFNYQTLMENLERKLILKALEQNQWNRKKAAQRLGIPLRSFFRKISQHGFDKKG
ncbi:sigma 54-interacting transcriptional regulator [bacterium]|nr:sigma 54-interacting transcriptional regulator [bacterium]